MQARKTIGRASTFLTGIVADSSPLPQPVTQDDAYYNAQTRAARPAILRYLNGNGPRPDDFWSRHDAAQDRKTLRRLHAKGLARDDARYFDALLEAARAGDLLSRVETKDLAEHMRVIEDGVYPAVSRRASELSAEVRVLGRTVGVLETEKTQRHTDELDNLAKATAVKKQREKKLNARVRTAIRTLWFTVRPRKRKVHSLTKMLCNPNGTKRTCTPRMERWKYRWMYKGNTETIPFWTLRRYVDRAITALKASPYRRLASS